MARVAEFVLDYVRSTRGVVQVGKSLREYTVLLVNLQKTFYLNKKQLKFLEKYAGKSRKQISGGKETGKMQNLIKRPLTVIGMTQPLTL